MKDDGPQTSDSSVQCWLWHRADRPPVRTCLLWGRSASAVFRGTGIGLLVLGCLSTEPPLTISTFHVFWYIYLFPEFTIMRSLSILCLLGQACQWQPPYTRTSLYTVLPKLPLQVCSSHYVTLRFVFLFIWLLHSISGYFQGCFLSCYFAIFPHLFRLKYSIYDKKKKKKEVLFTCKTPWILNTTHMVAGGSYLPKRVLNVHKYVLVFLLRAPARTLLKHQV